jgi:acetate kinase
MRILVVNGGSSTFKCWFHEVADEPLPVEAPTPLWQASVEWTPDGAVKTRIRCAGGAVAESMIRTGSMVEALPRVLESLWSGAGKTIRSPQEIDIVGHRVVQGGPELLAAATLLTPETRQAIAAQAETAPAHNRFELDAIQAVEDLLGAAVPQIAVFDTAFHATLEPAAYVYPGPYEWLDQGIRRYGFHGISYQYAARRAQQMLGARLESPRLIVCHLGNGASLAAIRGGKSVDTTMGFTPLEGLMMGTRSGSIDPSILIHLLRRDGYTADRLDKVLNQESGLKGVSGVSGDMREILNAMDNGNPRARLAFDIYTHRLCREVGAMLAVLGGVDLLVFTGGVGENCAPLRERVCRQLGFLGLRLDEEKNARREKDEDIAAPDSAVRVLVIRAEEDWEIARECHRYGTERGMRE